MNDAPLPCAAVTGGSAGIGRAICETLLAEGQRGRLARARRRRHSRIRSCTAIEVDLADRAATAEAARELAQRFAPTTLVHNAGVIRPALLADVKLDDLDALVELHLGCAIQLVQAALPGDARSAASAASSCSRRAPRSALRRAPATRPPRPACSAWRAPGRSSSRPTASPSTSSRRGRSAPTCSTTVVPAGSEQEQRLAASIPVRRIGEAADVARAVALLRRRRPTASSPGRCSSSAAAAASAA